MQNAGRRKSVRLFFYLLVYLLPFERIIYQRGLLHVKGIEDYPMDMKLSQNTKTHPLFCNTSQKLQIGTKYIDTSPNRYYTVAIEKQNGTHLQHMQNRSGLFLPKQKNHTIFGPLAQLVRASGS